MIEFTLSPGTPALTKQGEKRLRKMVEMDMEALGCSGPSQSGTSAIMAIEWCKRNELPFELGCVFGMYWVNIPKIFFDARKGKPSQ